MNKDTLHVLTADWHSGSNYALFLGRNWQGKKTAHVPKSTQVKIRNHFLQACAEVKAKRSGRVLRA